MTEAAASTQPEPLVSLVPNGPQIPPLGIGTWSWGDSLFWQYGGSYGVEDVRQAFNAAVKAGIRLFDTAEVYGLGKSEELLGEFMAAIDEPVAVATKYFPMPWRFNSQAVADALTASLKRLRVPSVALYQVHWPFDFLMGQPTLMDALADEVEQGRIQSIGVSNYSASQMYEAHGLLAKRGIPLAVNQVQYSLLHRRPETKGVIGAARDLDVVILAYSPLAQGLLTGKYTAQTQPPGGARRLDPRFSQGGLRRLQPLLTLMEKIGEQRDKTPAQVALNWLICQGNVVPIPGAKTAAQAMQNAGALGWSLTAAEQDALQEASEPWR